MKKNLKTYLLIIILLCLCNIIWAQKQIFSHYSIEQGLSQSVINCIFQDSEGYLWIGTQDGLNKYDGYIFQRFINNPQNSNSLANNWIYCITEDSSGIIWIGTRDGLHSYNKKNNTFIRYPNSSGEDSRINYNQIYGVASDNKGKIFTNTPPVLNVIDTKTGDTKHYINSIGYTSSVNEVGFPILLDTDNRIWIATAGGLAVFNQNSGDFVNYAHNEDLSGSISDDFITSIFQDNKKNFWIGTKNGLNKFDKSKGIFIKWFAENSTNSLSSNFIRAISQDYYGNMWIGTEGGGLNKITFDKNEKAIIHVFKQISRQSQLSIHHDIVLSLLVDKSNNLWIGTLNGIDKTDLKRKKFKLYNSSEMGGSLKLSDNVIASLFKDSTDNIWIGTWGKGLNIFNRKTGKIDEFTSKSNIGKRISNDFVHVIFQDSKGIIWIGTRNGLDIFHNIKKEFLSAQNYFNNQSFNNLKNIRILCMLEDHLKNIWIGTQNGLYIYKSNQNQLEPFISNRAQNKISSKLINTIYQTRDKNIWIGTVDGLDKYICKNDEIIHFKNQPEQTNTLINNYVISLCEDSDGNLWIGTKSGLNKFIPSDSTFVFYSEKEGLPSNVIYEIIEDSKQNVWFSTGRGLSKFNKYTNKFKNYDLDDGLQDLEFNLRASFKSKDGEMFFGGMNGINAFYPDSIVENPFAPDIVITKITKSNKYGVTRIDYQKNERILLKPDDFDLTIEFAALEYSNQAKNQYEYKISGNNNIWVNIGNRRLITFSNLAAGDYTINIRGANNDGIWNENGITIQVVVLNSWWKTKLAIFFYILILTMLVFFVIKYRERNLKKQKMLLEEKIQERTELIEKQKTEIIVKNYELNKQNQEISIQRDELKELNSTKDRLFSIIGHDLKNPFSAILSLAELLNSEYESFKPEEIKETLEHILKSAKFSVELLDNLLQWAKIQRKNIQVTFESFQMKYLIDETFGLLAENAKNKSISLNSLLPSDLFVYADRNMISTVVRNLVTNAIKFTGQKGSVTVDYSFNTDTPNFVEISVSDTGIGIRQETMHKLFKVDEIFSTHGTKFEKGTGLGLILVKEFVERNGGQIRVTSKVGEGSIFTFTIPLYKS